MKKAKFNYYVSNYGELLKRHIMNENGKSKQFRIESMVDKFEKLEYQESYILIAVLIAFANLKLLVYKITWKNRHALS